MGDSAESAESAPSASTPQHALSETKARADTTGAVKVSLGVGLGQGGDGKAPLPSGTSE
jgi:hypothetical protein